jgi:hypothetical protein
LRNRRGPRDRGGFALGHTAGHTARGSGLDTVIVARGVTLPPRPFLHSIAGRPSLMRVGRRKLRWRRIARALAVLLLGLAVFGTCAVRSGDFLAGADRAISEAVRATATGRRPDGVDVVIERRASSGASWDPAADFGRPYTIEGADTYFRGVSPLAVVDPLASAYVAHLAFAGGRTWHVEAWREPNGRWIVQLWPAEGQ